MQIKKSIWPLTVAILATPLLIYALVHSYQIKFNKLPVFGEKEIIANRIVSHRIEQFEFINQGGRSFSSDMLKNKIVVCCFFFSSCPSVCPNMIRHIKNVQGNFLNDPHVAFVSFTVDPVRDSVKKLQWYINHNNIDTKNWDFLTGDKKQIYKLARKSFYLSAVEGDGGESDFIHSDQLVLVDVNRQIRGYYKGTDDNAVKQLIDDIKKLENEK